MPFVEGHLIHQPVSTTITSVCAHSGEPIELEIDSLPRCRVVSGPMPLAFVPIVNFSKVKAPNIIDVF